MKQVENIDQRNDQHKQAIWLFKQDCIFLRGTQDYKDMPEFNLPEVGFIGRSNVGKSSLLNALTNRHTLARISKTPGRTQQINFFKLNNQIILVDMPGYGYAQASKKMIESWTKLIQDYLSYRTSLKRIYLLVDIRHGLKPNDQEMMSLLDTQGISYQVILTKDDKVSSHHSQTIYDQTYHQIKNHAAAYPEIISTSAQTKKGIDQLQLEISQFALLNH